MYSVNSKKTLPYSAHQLHELASDVANYPKFLPWVKAVRIWDRSDDGKKFNAELMIGYKNFRIPFSTEVTIDVENCTIKTRNIEDKGRGFLGLKSPIKNLNCLWSFTQTSGNTDVGIKIDLAFRDLIIGTLVGNNLDRATNKLIDMFTSEANKRFGANKLLQGS